MHPLLRPFTIATALLAAFAPLFAADTPSYQGSGEPLHPTAIMTLHNNENVPVVGVDWTNAQIEVQGKRVRATDKGGFKFIRMPHFAPGSFVVQSHSITEGQPKREYVVSLVADTTYPEAYIVLIVFDGRFLAGTASDPKPALVFQKVYGFQQNEPKTIKIDLSAVSKTRNTQFFPLVFVNGREVRTSLCEMSAAYFRRLELTRHTKMISDYRSKNKNSDQALQPYVRIAPILEVSGDGPATTVQARVAIDEQGLVTHVELQTEVPAAIEAGVERALRGWLFYPKLVKGRPVAAQAVVPLRISLPAP